MNRQTSKPFTAFRHQCSDSAQERIERGASVLLLLLLAWGKSKKKTNAWHIEIQVSHFNPGLAFCPGRLQPQQAALLQVVLVSSPNSTRQTQTVFVSSMHVRTNRPYAILKPQSMFCSHLAHQVVIYTPKEAFGHTSTHSRHLPTSLTLTSTSTFTLPSPFA